MKIGERLALGSSLTDENMAYPEHQARMRVRNRRIMEKYRPEGSGGTDPLDAKKEKEDFDGRGR